MSGRVGGGGRGGRGGAAPPAEGAKGGKDGGANAVEGGKPKYSDMAREEGWVDLELIEAIERDIVEQVRCPN